MARIRITLTYPILCYCIVFFAFINLVPLFLNLNWAKPDMGLVDPEPTIIKGAEEDRAQWL